MSNVRSRSPRTAPHPLRPRGGRPSRETSERLNDQLLEVATELLFDRGYGSTSIEMIAAKARVSKRTIYHRFEDKAALMTAVVRRLVDSLRPPPGVPLMQGVTLEQKLQSLGLLILRAALTPKVLALQRLIVAESRRFPDLAQAVTRSGGRQEAVGLICGLLLQEAGAPGLDERAARFAAEQFLQLITSQPQARALGLGEPMSAAELDDWVRHCVALLLGGIGALGRSFA